MFVTRIKALNRYQKAVLIVMGVMILIFTVLYFRTISRGGIVAQLSRQKSKIFIMN